MGGGLPAGKLSDEHHGVEMERHFGSFTTQLAEAQ